MRILGIESSCDETAAAILGNGGKVLSSVVASQVETHREYGGVVPELASREHVDNICFVVDEALQQAVTSFSDLDGVAVTRGPGLVGALLVGLAYAKSLAFSHGLPFVGVNHLEGHVQSVFLDNPKAELPVLSLVVSGGHTNLYFLESTRSYRLLARTRDDAAGESLDKLSKHLGLGYPGGPVIERLASRGDENAVPFTLSRTKSGGLDFSFSGIKTAAIRAARERGLEALKVRGRGTDESQPQEVLDLVASFQKAIFDQLLDRLEKALEDHPAASIHISGGVSCNRTLREQVRKRFAADGIPVYYPRPALTTDNAAMIAAAGLRRLEAGETDPWDLDADPNLALHFSSRPSD